MQNTLRSFFNKFRRGTKRTQHNWSKARANQSRNTYSESDQKKIPVAYLYLAISALLVGIFAFGYYFVPLVYQYLIFETQGVNETALQVASENRWNGEDRMTILLIGLDQQDTEHAFVDALVVVNIEPNDSRAGVFAINPDINVFVPGLGKNSNIRTIYNNPEAKGRQISLIKEGVESLLALRIDRYAYVNKQDMYELSAYFDSLNIDVPAKIYDPDTNQLPGNKYLSWTKGERAIQGEEFLGFLASDQNGRNDQLDRQMKLFVEWLQNYQGLKAISNAKQILELAKTKVKTNLNKQELTLMAWKLRDVREEKIKKGFTQQTSYTQQKTNAFYPSYAPIQEGIDQDISSIFFNINVLREQAKIEILNGSGVRGLANNRSRWITNAGGRVILADNFDENIPKTKIYVQDPSKFKLTMHELVKIFNDKAEIIEEDFPQRHLGDIVIILGVEYQ